MAKSASTPPPCNICNHSHWRHEPHIWSGLSSVVRDSLVVKPPAHNGKIEGSIPSRATKSKPAKLERSSEVEPRTVNAVVAGSTPAASATPKTDRKEYLKLKARERRLAEKAGLSVKEYRVQQLATELNTMLEEKRK